MGVNQEERSLCCVSTPWAGNKEVLASTGAFWTGLQPPHAICTALRGPQDTV